MLGRTEQSKSDNPVGMMADAVWLGRLLLKRTAWRFKTPQSDFHLALYGLATMAVELGEQMLWAHQVRNHSAFMLGSRSLLELTWNLDFLTDDPSLHEARGKMFIGMHVHRLIEVMEAIELADNIDLHPEHGRFLSFLRERRQQRLVEISSMVPNAAEPQVWRKLSAKRLAERAEMAEFYTTLYEIGSGYVHADGSAVMDILGPFNAKWSEPMHIAALGVLEAQQHLLRNDHELRARPEVGLVWDQLAVRWNWEPENEHEGVQT